jgi:hypothetical protein
MFSIFFAILAWLLSWHPPMTTPTEPAPLAQHVAGVVDQPPAPYNADQWAPDVITVEHVVDDSDAPFSDGFTQSGVTTDDEGRTTSWATSTPPVPPATDAPDWTGWEYLLEPQPMFTPLSEGESCWPTSSPTSLYPGLTRWALMPCIPPGYDPAWPDGAYIVDACVPVDPATTWECVTSFTRRHSTLEPREF